MNRLKVSAIQLVALVMCELFSFVVARTAVCRRSDASEFLLQFPWGTADWRTRGAADYRSLLALIALPPRKPFARYTRHRNDVTSHLKY